MASFVTRFPYDEIVRLGPQLNGAVTEHASTNAVLVSTTTDLAAVAEAVAKASRPGRLSLAEKDWVRDELVRALALGVESKTHRVDKPAVADAANKAMDQLFADGYGWVNAALGVETKRLGKLFTDAEEEKTAAALETIGMTETLQALSAAQDDFVATEKEYGSQSTSGKEVTKQLRRARDAFHRKLDIYVALVNDDYLGDAPQPAVADALFEPLVEATTRMRRKAAGGQE